MISLAKETGAGIYPETKHPTALLALGLDMEAALLEALRGAGWSGAAAPVYVQSFEPAILKSLNDKIEVPLVQLIYAVNGKPNISLLEVADYADGVGVQKTLVITPSGEGTDLVKQAHGLGLFVHVWTVRDDEPPLDGVPVDEELRRLYHIGIDGVFADFPKTARAVLGAPHPSN